MWTKRNSDVQRFLGENVFSEFFYVFAADSLG